MSWSTGAALILAVYVAVAFVYIAWPRRPSRKWLRDYRKLERARIAWQAKVIEDQCFWRKP